MSLLTLWGVLSQVVPPVDPVTTIGSGWAGAGLLGLVLSWLLFIHLPRKDAQILELVKNKDAAVSEVVKSFREEAALERASCERNISNLASAIEKLREGRHV